MAYQTSYKSYGNCDSYFVETHDDDDGTFARAAAERQRVRHVHQAQQKAIGEELCRLTALEWQDEILEHMEDMEEQTMPDINSMEVQTEIQWFMRPYLLDFLLETHHTFQLLPETLFLTINLLDRYCSKRVVYKRHYQLVGCAALLIAAKYGDRKERVPTIRELKLMCCSLYEDDMFTQMEWHVLQTLNWMIGHPTASSFMQQAVYETQTDAQVEHMALYISEISLYHKDFIMVKPSDMARSSLVLARCVLNRPQLQSSDWADAYDVQLVVALSNHLGSPSQALYRKYSSSYLSCVSTILERYLHERAVIASATAQLQTACQIDPQPMSMDPAAYDPQTPQKPTYPMPIAGFLTPPITPDKGYQQNGVQVGQPHVMAAQHHGYTPIPTPPPQVSMPEHYAYPAYTQQQYMVQ